MQSKTIKIRSNVMMRNEESNSKIPRSHFPSHLCSHVSVLISRLLIAMTLLTRASTGRRGEERRGDNTTSAGGRFKMREECAREDVKEGSDYVETIRRRSRKRR